MTMEAICTNTQLEKLNKILKTFSKASEGQKIIRNYRLRSGEVEDQGDGPGV